jgi:hypothetical protein
MTSLLFLVFVAVMAITVVFIVTRYLTRGLSGAILIGLVLWLCYVGTLSYFGVVSNPALRPPGVFLLLLPVFLFVFLGVARSRRGAEVAVALPIGLILGLQAFRVGVELFIHQLAAAGLAPRLMTYDGGNVDIFIGLTALPIAWLATTGRLGLRVALIWNVIGLLSLANIAARSALTAPGPLNFVHSEIPNLAIGLFPFTFIAGFFAPLAVVLHVLSIRGLRPELRATREDTFAAPATSR